MKKQVSDALRERIIEPQKSSHTPGPLEAQGSSVIGVPKNSPVNIKVQIADCYGARGISQTERHANARLYAAAPEMLDALKEAHSYFRNRPGNHETQLAEMCGAAISKAEGGK